MEINWLLKYRRFTVIEFANPWKSEVILVSFFWELPSKTNWSCEPKLSFKFFGNNLSSSFEVARKVGKVRWGESDVLAVFVFKRYTRTLGSSVRPHFSFYLVFLGPSKQNRVLETELTSCTVLTRRIEEAILKKLFKYFFQWTWTITRTPVNSSFMQRILSSLMKLAWGRLKAQTSWHILMELASSLKQGIFKLFQGKKKWKER